MATGVSRTVYSPVSLSMLTWVTCMGFVGVDMVGRRGEPSMLLTKLENPRPDFFFPPSDFLFLAVPSPSPLYRCRGLFVPPESLRGGVSMVFFVDCVRERVKDALCRSFGDFFMAEVVGGLMVVWECSGGEGRVEMAAKIEVASNGLPKVGCPTRDWLELFDDAETADAGAYCR